MASIGPDKIQLCVCVWGWGGDQGQADGPGAVIPHVHRQENTAAGSKKREV
jgi:hypothetical protein